MSIHDPEGSRISSRRKYSTTCIGESSSKSLVLGGPRFFEGKQRSQLLEQKPNRSCAMLAYVRSQNMRELNNPEPKHKSPGGELLKELSIGNRMRECTPKQKSDGAAN
jgi:hypothetical protein